MLEYHCWFIDIEHIKDKKIEFDTLLSCMKGRTQYIVIVLDKMLLRSTFTILKMIMM